MRQAIIWTNADWIHKRIYAAPRGDVLTPTPVLTIKILGIKVLHKDAWQREQRVYTISANSRYFTIIFLLISQNKYRQSAVNMVRYILVQWL